MFCQTFQVILIFSKFSKENWNTGMILVWTATLVWLGFLRLSDTCSFLTFWSQTTSQAKNLIVHKYTQCCVIIKLYTIWWKKLSARICLIFIIPYVYDYFNKLENMNPPFRKNFYNWIEQVHRAEVYKSKEKEVPFFSIRIKPLKCPIYSR